MSCSNNLIARSCDELFNGTSSGISFHGEIRGILIDLFR